MKLIKQLHLLVELTHPLTSLIDFVNDLDSDSLMNWYLMRCLEIFDASVLVHLIQDFLTFGP